MTLRRAFSLTFAGLLLLVLAPPDGLSRWLNSGDRIDDARFWRMFSEFSEPSGYFQSDNLVSNERTFPVILDEIANRSSLKSAYVGVGPEQNFTYLAALRPRIAFIVDIRRQNAMLHLLYKALFELASDRADFLSRLFSRPRPRGLDAGSDVRALMDAFAAAPASASRFEENLKDVRARLVGKHRFAMTDEDLAALKYVYTAFFESGPALQYTSGPYRRGRPFPSFAELMTAVDDEGAPRSFLATEDNYRFVRELQRRNLIVPVVGDFGGARALQSVGRHLRERGLIVAVFYTSNVESYLFRNDQWRPFYGNVGTLPVDPKSVLVRSVFGGFGGGGVDPGQSRMGTLQLDPIGELVAAFQRDEISSYGTLVARH